MKLFTLCAVFLAGVQCVSAGSRSSSNYSIVADTTDTGGSNTGSANYSQTATAGSLSGTSSGAQGALLLSGYVAQLNFNPPGPLAVLSAVSRKVHGGARTFDINLPGTSAPGIECRNGGPGGTHQVVVVFPAAVTVGGLSVMSIDGMASGTRTVSGAIVTVNLSSVTNAQTLGITLLAVSDGSTTADVVIRMGVLAGDTTASAAVNSGDAAQTRNRSGQAADATNFRSDVNADGFVNSGDSFIVRSRSGTALP
jgi:hypothetical protein